MMSKLPVIGVASCTIPVTLPTKEARESCEINLNEKPNLNLMKFFVTCIGFGSRERTTPACSVILCQNRGETTCK